MLGICYRNSVIVVILFPASTAWIAGVSSGGFEVGAGRGFSLNSFDYAASVEQCAREALRIEETYCPHIRKGIDIDAAASGR